MHPSNTLKEKEREELFIHVCFIVLVDDRKKLLPALSYALYISSYNFQTEIKMVQLMFLSEGWLTSNNVKT